MEIEAPRRSAPGALRPRPQAVVVLRVRERSAILGELQQGCSEKRQLDARFERRDLRRFVRALLGVALLQQLAATHPPEHPLGNARRDRGELLARRRRVFVKDDGAPRRFAREDSVELFGESVRPYIMVLIEEVADGGYGRADEVFSIPRDQRAS
jgi:hypothetical protein